MGGFELLVDDGHSGVIAIEYGVFQQKSQGGHFRNNDAGVNRVELYGKVQVKEDLEYEEKPTASIKLSGVLVRHLSLIHI